MLKSKKVESTLLFKKVQAVESQVLSTRGQADVNLHRPTQGGRVIPARSSSDFYAACCLFSDLLVNKIRVTQANERPAPLCSGASSETRFKLKALLSFSQSNFKTGGCFQARV